MCVRERAGGRPRLREGRGSGLTGTRVGSTCAGRVVLFSFSGETEYKIVRHKKEPLKKKKKKKNLSHMDPGDTVHILPYFFFHCVF